MPDITFEIYLCALLIGLVGGLQAAGAQRSPKLPSQRYPSVQSSESVPVKHLPDVKANARRATEERQEGEIAPYRYGRVLQTTITPQSHGTWERLPNGSWLWRLRLHSEDAISLSLGFSEFALPNGARLYVHGEDKGLLHGPYTDADVTDGKHRTPLVQGDDIVVELTVPEGRRSALALTLGTVVHGSRPLRPARRSKSGTCNVDVACNEGDPWRNQVRSVGLYSFEKDNSAYVCTGTLVNNTARNGRPFFLTAEHCVSSPEVASTMVFYWNYQNATCRVQGSDRNGQVTADDRLAQTSSGAVLRARLGSTHERGEIHGKPDLALVEVDDVIPLEYGLFFSGWTRSRTPSKVGATVHHPAGHGKRISFDRDATSVTAFGGETGEGSTHLRIGEWDLGTTEAGSSGAPLYNDQQRIVGVLSGGLAGCRRGAAEDNDKPDWYGRIALGFTSGDYTPEGFQRPATLADWLDPTDSGAKALGGYSQVGRGAPEVPSGLKASTTVDRVVLDWASSRSDDVVGYRVYRGVTPVDSTLVAQSIHTFFGQTRAGTTSFVDTTIAPDTKYHYRVTAVDSTRRASSFSAGVQVSPGKQLVTYHIEVASGWNMVSTPVRPSAKGFASALPSGCESPYRWRPAQGAYQELGSGKTLAPGGGAWTFCQSGGTAEVTGTPVSSSDKAVQVEAGWNQVGPFEADIAPGEVRQDPSGILQAGTWFRWDPGQGQYANPSMLEPGQGYWVFATGSGTLDFSGGGSKQATAAAVSARSKGAASAGEAPEEALTLQVTDRAGHSREVHLARQLTEKERGRWRLPPSGPGSAFAARFAGGFQAAEASGSSRQSGQPEGALLQVKGAEGRPVLRLQTGKERLQGRSVRVVDAATGGDLLEARLTPESPSVEVPAGAERLRLSVESVPEEVALQEPYPNPASGEVTLQYALPERRETTIKVYDVLGREVATLADGGKEAGRHRATLEASRLPSGTYFARMQAGSFTKTRRVTVVK